MPVILRERHESGTKPGKTIVSDMQPKTMATEESPDAGWQEKPCSVIGLKAMGL